MSPQQLINIIRTFVFGPTLVLAFLVGAFVFWRKGKEEYYDQAELMDVLISSCLVGLLGARLGFVLVHFPEFGFDVVKWFSLLTYPGYLGIAGILAGFFSLVQQSQKRKWDAYEVADFGAIALSLALVLIFFGMFLNGSGFGNVTSLPIGMQFPGVFDRRHPVQLYAMVLYVICFIVLWKLEKNYRTFLWYRANRRTAQSGFVLSSFLIGYGLIGLVLAFFQPSFLTLYGIHVEALVRGGMVVAGMMLMFVRSGHSGQLGKKKAS